MQESQKGGGAMTECSCWVKYPNPMHKNKNGSWKCVDKYECVQDLEIVETPIGLTAIRRKTHCRRKEQEEKEVTNQEAIQDLREAVQPVVGGKSIEMAINALEIFEKAKEAGMHGEEVEFYIGGRKFAIRELAQ